MGAAAAGELGAGDKWLSNLKKSSFLAGLAARTLRAAGGRLLPAQLLSPRAARPAGPLSGHLPQRPRPHCDSPARLFRSGSQLTPLSLQREVLWGLLGIYLTRGALRVAPRRGGFQISRDAPGSCSPRAARPGGRGGSPGAAGRGGSAPCCLLCLGSRAGSQRALKCNFRNLGHVCKAVTRLNLWFSVLV